MDRTRRDLSGVERALGKTHLKESLWLTANSGCTAGCVCNLDRPASRVRASIFVSAAHAY
jgi:hypothetical protein